MIPTHLLASLAPDDRVAVLARDGDIHFLVHRAADGADDVRARAAREGSTVLASHLLDEAAIRRLVASRERDVGGEG